MQLILIKKLSIWSPFKESACAPAQTHSLIGRYQRIDFWFYFVIYLVSYFFFKYFCVKQNWPNRLVHSHISKDRYSYVSKVVINSKKCRLYPLTKIQKPSLSEKTSPVPFCNVLPGHNFRSTNQAKQRS